MRRHVFLAIRNLLAEVQKICISIANAACEGLQPDGSLVYEKDISTGHVDKDRHWWVQAEAVVGFMNTYELTGEEKWKERALKCWNYISQNQIDRTGKEWFWSISDDGIPNRKDDKAGFWKCPYHNSRMCLEVLMR